VLVEDMGSEDGTRGVYIWWHVRGRERSFKARRSRGTVRDSPLFVR